MTTIDTSLLLSNYQDSQTTTSSDTLGKDDFLKLLMTQLQNQDPSEPMDDTEFIAQMATFSSLEQMTNIAESMETLIDSTDQGNLLSYNSFIGQEVDWNKVTTDDSGDYTVDDGTGIVASIQYTGDSVSFILEDGTTLEPANISQLNASSSSSNSLLSSSELIGKLISYLNSDDEEVSSIVKSVLMKNGVTQFELSDEAGTKITSDQITQIATA